MNQTQRILSVLRRQRRKGLTAAEAADRFGIYRLSARIYDIKALGYCVVDAMERGINREGNRCKWKRYWLEEK